MFKRIKFIQGIILIAICLTMVSAAGAGGAAGVKNYAQVHNNWDIAMNVSFKCYTNTSWESNTCASDNTPETIEPGNSPRYI